MSGLRSGAVLLLLAIPFGLYAAWQIQSATRADTVGESPDRGLPDEKRLLDAKAATEKWTRDVRRTAAVAFQYRRPGPEDKADDPDCAAVARAVASRADDLTDLEKFLSGVDRPTYAGALKERYAEWQAAKVKLAKAEDAVETWLRNPLTGVDGSASAAQALKAFDSLLVEYRKDAKFADSSRATAWQVEARVKVLAALEDAARGPYGEVLALPLPLPSPKDSKLVERAVGVPAAIREQAKLLREDLTRADEARQKLPERVAKDASAAVRRSDEWAAREQFLSLLADPELFTDPHKAGDWLSKVQAQFDMTQSEAGKELIRKKVQQFCEAYVPRAARLDSKVLIQGKEVNRAGVEIEYATEPKSKAYPLGDHPDGLNEFNFADFHRGFDRIVWSGGGKYSGTKSALQPTRASLAARDFTLARATVTSWTPAALMQLKKKCEGEVEAVQRERCEALDTLSGAGPLKDAAAKEPVSAWTRENSKVWTRVSGLAAAAAKHPDLFGTGP